MNSTHFGNPNPSQEHTRGLRKLQIAASVAAPTPRRTRSKPRRTPEPPGPLSSFPQLSGQWSIHVPSSPLIMQTIGCQRGRARSPATLCPSKLGREPLSSLPSQTVRNHPLSRDQHQGHPAKRAGPPGQPARADADRESLSSNQDGRAGGNRESSHPASSR